MSELIQDELSQWCEIDGHEWNSYYLEHGLFLGPRHVDMSKLCVKCKKIEQKILVPYNSESTHYELIRTLIGY